MKDILKNKNIEVENINADSEILFDIERLHQSKFKELVQYYDSISGSPTEYILTGTLAALAGVIGKQVFFKVSDYIKIYVNIYAMLIGKSTIMRKSSALSLTTREIQSTDNHNRYTYNKALKEYELKTSEFKKKDYQQNYSELEKPQRDYLLFPQDTTVEALTEILSQAKRGLLIHSELGGWLAAMNKGYSGDSKMFFTNIFDVPETYEVDRIVKGSTFLHRPFISICGASTISWLIENSTASDITSGFFARFIYAIRNKPTKRYIPLLELRNITARIENTFNVKEIIERLYQLELTEIDITKEASQFHISYDKSSFAELLECEDENQLSFESRLLIYSIKFAMIIALTDNRIVIEKRDVEDAILLVEYYKKNVELLLNRELNQTEFTRNEEKILKIIKRSKNGIIKRSDLLNRTKFNAKELTTIIENLMEKELITSEKNSNPNRKGSTTFYKIIDN